MLVLDPDYDYGRHLNNNGFHKYVTIFAIYKLIWRALNPEANHIRNLRDVRHWRELNAVLNRFRTRLHYQSWRRRLTLRIKIEQTEKERAVTVARGLPLY